MFQVTKRDGETAEFTLGKIKNAIIKAFDATSVQYSEDIVDLLSLRVTAKFPHPFSLPETFHSLPLYLMRI